MNKPLLLLLFCLGLVNARAQIATEPRTEEYAIVRAILSSPSGTFSSHTTLPNPFLELEGLAMELKDFVKDPKGIRFTGCADMLNYMNKFGWTLYSHEKVEIKDQTGDYTMFYTFRRKPKK